MKYIKRLQTDFLGLGVDRDEAGMLDRFLKNVLNVAESKFSTAKLLHAVCRGHGNSEIYWLNGTHFMPTCVPCKGESEGLQETMVSITKQRLSDSSVPRLYCFAVSVVVGRI